MVEAMLAGKSLGQHMHEKRAKARVYEASQIKRRRATRPRSSIAESRSSRSSIAMKPMIVRNVFYQ